MLYSSTFRFVGNLFLVRYQPNLSFIITIVFFARKKESRCSGLPFDVNQIDVNQISGMLITRPSASVNVPAMSSLNASTAAFRMRYRAFLLVISMFF
jgi:hypothetical protein